MHFVSDWLTQYPACVGIGQTCAQQFALNGCQSLFLVDLSRSKLEKTAALIESTGQQHPQIELCECNVADEASVKAMVTRCVEVFGRIDVACNNAGVSGREAVRTHEAKIEDFDFVCDVNERGVCLLSLLTPFLAGILQK